MSSGGAGRAGSIDAKFDAALALGQTVDSGDSSQHPAPAPGRALPNPVEGSASSFALEPTGASGGPEPAGLDATSDGFSGVSRESRRGGTGNVVSVAGDNILGSVIGERYRLEKRVGEGGMGIVYQAEHLALKTKVAVKVLVRSAGEISRKRFLLEAQMASKVRHPNIVYLADYGVLSDSRPYLVMEFLSGPTLAEVLRTGPLPPLRAYRIALQIAKGMQTVHDQGIVHRDLKPSNIFLLPGDATVGQEDFVKIVDFGVAKDTSGLLNQAEAERDGDGATPSETSAGGATAARDQQASLGSALTRADAQVGTPQYMAPEQIDGGIVDARTDQYAFGCILYRMLTGSLPFMADTAEAVMRMHVETNAVPPRQRLPELTISDAIEALVLRCLAKHAEDRFTSMSELAQVLTAEIDGLEGRNRSHGVGPSSRSAIVRGLASDFFVKYGRPRTWLLAALGLGLSLGIIATLVLRRGPSQTNDGAARPSLAEIIGLRQRAVQILTQALQAPTPELRRMASQALGRAGEISAKSAIGNLLSDQTPEVRAQAALSLARLGDAATASELRRTLEGDSAASVKVAAASAMAQLGDEGGTRFLRQALEGSAAAGSPTGSDLRLRAAFLLCDQGDLRAVELLTTWLERGILPAAVQGGALGCLSQAAVASATRQLLTRMQSSAPMEERIAAAARLVKAREPQALAFLRQLSHDAGPHQLLAARTLAAPSEPAVGPVLRKVLADREAAVPARVLAVEGLGLLGQLGDLRLLGQSLDSLGNDAAFEDLRQALAAAILDVSQSDPAVMSAQSLSWARSALSDNDWVVRSEALLVLAESDQGEDLQRITSLVTDSDARVRRNAARALGRRRDTRGIASLQQALKDSDASVRQEAWGSLGRLAKNLTGDERRAIIADGQRSLSKAVENGTVEEQVIARSALATLGDSEQRAGLRKLAESGDANTRRAVAEHSKEDQELLRRLLRDREFSVRFAAAQRLAEAGEPQAAPVLREGLARGGSDGLTSYSLLRRLGQPATAPSDLGQRLAHGTQEERAQIV
ncbi:MAG TPA: HEAT repeat domain-containing protein, partial [Pseudomonadota bacterium]|nr:HEAT repeat domain-containing protein [Pseudomonadota bacterium]